mgnify:FL=1
MVKKGVDKGFSVWITGRSLRRLAKSGINTPSMPNTLVMMISPCLGDSKLAALQPLTDPWEHCLNRIGSDIPQQQFNTWIRPLQAQWQGSGLMLAAPNRFIRDFVTRR